MIDLQQLHDQGRENREKRPFFTRALLGVFGSLLIPPFWQGENTNALADVPAKLQSLKSAAANKLDPVEQEEKILAGSQAAGVLSPAKFSVSIQNDGLGTTRKVWTTSRISFNNVDSSGYGGYPMKPGEIGVKICKGHFKSGSVQRQQILDGIAYYSQVSGLDLSLVAGSYSHQSIDDRFPLIPTSQEIRIDYAYNSGNEGYIPCHKPNPDHSKEEQIDEQWGFTGNSCSHSFWGWSKSGDTNASRISVNPLNVSWNSSTKSETRTVRYRHFWDVTGEKLPYTEADSSSDGYAKRALFSHEIGHSLGMNHTDSWPAALGMISTMQSHIRTMTAFDLAFLKHYYGLKSGSTAIKKCDLVASHLVRYNVTESSTDLQYKNFDFGTDEETGDLNRINPLYLYASNGQYLDCRTQKSPRFHATWFNDGTQEIAENSKIVAQFTASTLSFPSSTVALGSFTIGQMEGLSQRYWSGQVLLPTSEIGVPESDTPSSTTVSFKLDSGGALSEASESNNSVSAVVYLLRAGSLCDKSAYKAKTNYYLDGSGQIRGYY